MSKKIENELELGTTVSPFDTIGASSAIERSTSNFLTAGEKVQKIRKSISAGTCDADIAKYIPVNLDQGIKECWKIETQRNNLHTYCAKIDKFRLLNNINQ